MSNKEAVKLLEAYNQKAYEGCTAEEAALTKMLEKEFNRVNNQFTFAEIMSEYDQLEADFDISNNQA